MTESSTTRKPRPGLGRGLSALMGDMARAKHHPDAAALAEIYSRLVAER